MPCYHPIDIFRPARHRLQTVACGRCIGCRLEKSRQWAVRIMHEAQLYDENRFVTLTYSDEHLPENSSLDKSAFPKFMKRLRKRFPDEKIRYFHCGEYGSQMARPHYHACLLNFGFPDEVVRLERGGIPVSVSEELSDLWPYGFHEVGSLTFESAAYVARYVTKKVTGRSSDEHYSRVDRETGEMVAIVPEYATMSLRPGIGKPFFDRFWKDIYPSDEVIVRGHPCKPPRYYDQLLEAVDPDLYREVKDARGEDLNEEDNTPARLRDRERVTEARVTLYAGRQYEDEAFRGS